MVSALDLGAALVALGLFVFAPMRPSLVQSLDRWLCSGAAGVLVDFAAYFDVFQSVPGPPWTSPSMYVVTAQLAADLLMVGAVVAALFRRARPWSRLLGAGAATSLLMGRKPFYSGEGSPVLCDGLRFVPLLLALVIAVALLDPELRRRYGTVFARGVAVMALALLVTPNCSDRWLAFVPWGANAFVLALSVPLLVTGLPPPRPEVTAPA